MTAKGLLRAVTLAAALSVTLGLFALLVTQGVARPLRWDIVDGYTGWILAQYGDSTCPVLRSDGLFDVFVVDANGHACTSSGIRHGWYFVDYRYLGDGAIDRSRVSSGSIDWERQRETFFVGRREDADPANLPSDWR